jgi:serine phosphatase RsbU (regulator of sigma subunit)
MHHDESLTARRPSAAMVVDDDPGINRLLQVRLRNLGYTVSSATNGEEALAAISADPPDLMLLDVSMPGIGGLEVLEVVRAQQLDIAVIMSTAFGSERVAIDALRRGANDYLRKPFEPEEFRAVVDRTVEQLYLRRQNRALRSRLEAELRQAAGIQAGLLPERAPDVPGYEIVAYCRPANAVGGDFYDWQMQPDGALSFTLGDVMGKGMPAALLMTTVRAALRPIALDHSPGDCIRAVERALATDLDRSQSFVTLFHAQIEPASGEIVYVDAGHGLATVRRANGGGDVLDVRSLPLGLVAHDGIMEGRTLLDAGDTLLVYSDGLLDARPDHRLTPHDATGLIGDAATAGEMADRLIRHATTDGPAEDDLTFIIIHRLGEHVA